MISASAKLISVACLLGVVLTIDCLDLPIFPVYSICKAQDTSQVRKLNVESVSEDGCPVAVAAARTELDLDPFGAPRDARIYVDYKNTSEKAIAAVKFRVRFYDQDGKDRGTFHAPDARQVEPAGQGSQKWKLDRIDPRTAMVKMRALEVRFADGSSWQSVKMSEVVQPVGNASSPRPDPAGAASRESQADASTQSPSATSDAPASQSSPVDATAPAGSRSESPGPPSGGGDSFDSGG